MCNNKCIRDLILFKKKRTNRFIEVICVTCIWKFTDSFFFPIIKTLSLLSLTSYHKQMTYYIKPQMVNLEKKNHQKINLVWNIYSFLIVCLHFHCIYDSYSTLGHFIRFLVRWCVRYESVISSMSKDTCIGRSDI